MIIRRHMVDETVHLVGDGPVHDIEQNENILAAGGLLKNRSAFSGLETFQIHLHQIVFLIVVIMIRNCFRLTVGRFTE